MERSEQRLGPGARQRALLGTRGALDGSCRRAGHTRIRGLCDLKAEFLAGCVCFKNSRFQLNLQLLKESEGIRVGEVSSQVETQPVLEFSFEKSDLAKLLWVFPGC